MTLRHLGLLTVFLFTACALTPSTPQSTDPSPAPVFTAIPTLTPAPPTPTLVPTSTVIVMDFFDQMCNALWTNSGQEIPCPTDIMPEQIDVGYVNQFDPEPLGLPATAKVLVTYPAQDDHYAIFGRYPAFRVQAGDQFQAQLTCESGCDVEFALEYYDAQGIYHDHLASWQYQDGDPMISAVVDLTPLVGERVELTLAVRPNSNRERAWALWLDPQVVRTQP